MIFDPIVDVIDDAIDDFYYYGYAERLYNFSVRHRLKQKLLGILLIFCGILSGAIDVEPGVHDITFTVVLVPAGLWMIFTKTDLFDSQ